MALYHQTADFLSASWADHRAQLPLLAVTGASFALGLLAQSLIRSGDPAKNVFRSPRSTLLPGLSEQEIRTLPLPNDVLPGGRDVESPYGTLRVYEWGREDGPKVLMVHGITTPCIALGGLAHALVDRGCRVIVFDLFGRGYSDCPVDLPQDERLFATEILLALTSSPISWTGADSGKFCLVGYSLGGGIVANFASYFPNLLSSLVLLAPSGMMHDDHVNVQARLLYSRGLIPESVLGFFVKRRLRGGPLVPPKEKPKGENKVNVDDALTEEFAGAKEAATQILSREYPHLSVPESVVWQVDNNHGFVHAFMSTMRYGPIFRSKQWGAWCRLGAYLSAQNEAPAGSQVVKGLPNDKVHILCGNTDGIIGKDDLVTDATAALGGNAIFKFYDAGHEFPSTKYEDVASYMMKFL